MTTTINVGLVKKIKSPKKRNSLSNKLKKRLSLSNKVTPKSSSENTNTINSLNSINSNSCCMKKIKLKSKSPKSKCKGKNIIPLELSFKKTPELNKSSDIITSNTINPSSITASSITASSVITPPTILRKSKKSKKLSGKSCKLLKKKTISVKLNTDDVKKEKDILGIINNFEKMNVKEIKDYLKTKGIESKNNKKSKLLPYIYLLTCVDDDINIIKK